MVQVQTGNMLDVIVEGKSIGLKQRDSDHRKYDVIWLPKPEGLRDVLDAEIERLNPETRSLQSRLFEVTKERDTARKSFEISEANRGDDARVHREIYRGLQAQIDALRDELEKIKGAGVP